MSDFSGVAISTTGQAHRLPGLAACFDAWRKHLPLGSVLVVTVDGSAAEVEAARRAVNLRNGGIVIPVGKRLNSPDDERVGVAANKNTGIEFLMASGVTHLFLSDDDCYPILASGPTKHINLARYDGVLHSMVAWGAHRLERKGPNPAYVTWNWPRGVMLYAHSKVVETCGGMVEDFGLGGHEHAEWSRRIAANGFAPAPFVSPAVYGEIGRSGRPATRADALWHCEDMRGARESQPAFVNRKAAHTTIKRTREDWNRIEAVYAERIDKFDFVPFRANANGRASATLQSSLPSQGAEGDNRA
jgi:hypothetical protein